MTIQAPGGDRPRWAFDTVEDGSTEHDQARRVEARPAGRLGREGRHAAPGVPV